MTTRADNYVVIINFAKHYEVESALVSALVQTLPAACRRFAKVRTSNDGSCLREDLIHFHQLLNSQKDITIIMIEFG